LLNSSALPNWWTAISKTRPEPWHLAIAHFETAMRSRGSIWPMRSASSSAAAPRRSRRTSSPSAGSACRASRSWSTRAHPRRRRH
ncbi:hypothetical protein LTR94_032527, partial [Friedmanniomyces endolithicus]